MYKSQHRTRCTGEKPPAFTAKNTQPMSTGTVVRYSRSEAVVKIITANSRQAHTGSTPWTHSSPGAARTPV